MLDEALDAHIAGRPASASDRVRLDLPESFDYGNTVPFGFRIEAPMSGTDHVQRVDIFAEGNPFPEVATIHFTQENGVAEASTRIRLNAGLQEVVAVAELGDGSLLIGRRKVQVAISGCTEEPGVAAATPMPMPKPRLRVPKTIEPGSIVPIKSMISHRMETGLRFDGAGDMIPRRIIHRMTCHLDDRLVFAADLSPAIAANAYLGFSMIGRVPGNLVFRWHEDGGAIYHADSALPAV